MKIFHVMQLYVYLRYEPDAQKCPDYTGRPIGFGQCFTAFIVHIGGIVIGAIILM